MGLKINPLNNTPSARSFEWFFAILLSAVVAGAAIVSVPNFSPTNDDNVIADILSGFFSGEPDYHTVYVGTVYSWLLASLYTALPAVEWWVVAHEVVIFAACTICIRCVAYKRLLRPVRTIGFAASIVVAFVFYVPFASLNLATTSAATGAAALAVLLTKAANSEVYTFSDMVAVGIFLFLAYSYRQATFNIVAVFIFMTLLFGWGMVLRDTGGVAGQTAAVLARSLLRPVVVALILVAVAAVNEVAHAAAYGSPQWSEYAEFNRARSTYLDYRLTSYANDPELFNALGVSSERAYLINNWCMAEDVVDEGLYLDISASIDASLGTSAASIASVAKSALIDNPVAALMHVALFICAVLTVVARITSGDRRQTLYAVYSVGIFAASLVCLIYVSSLNRTPLRVLLSYLLPAVVVSVLVLVRSIVLCERLVLKDIVLSLLSALIVGTVFLSFRTLVKDDDLRLQTTLANRYEAVLRYGSEHEDSVIFRDSTIPQDRRMNSSWRVRGSHDNCIALGAWYVGSPLWQSQLDENGVESFTLDQLLKEDVFYASVKRDSGYWYGTAIEEYMYEMYGVECHFELQEQLDWGVGIFKLVLDS